MDTTSRSVSRVALMSVSRVAAPRAAVALVAAPRTGAPSSDEAAPDPMETRSNTPARRAAWMNRGVRPPREVLRVSDCLCDRVFITAKPRIRSLCCFSPCRASPLPRPFQAATAARAGGCLRRSQLSGNLLGLYLATPHALFAHHHHGVALDLLQEAIEESIVLTQKVKALV